MPTIYVDNQPYQVEDGQNLLQACLSLGFNLPYFCWHPAMHSVGACRQCAVKQFKDENDTRGRIVMACMTPATEGTRISIDDPDARAFRASVIEWLMVNHPHDCPVCDEGGECHLQDMTYMTGHVYRRYRFKKRTYRNQYLGPFVNHEMNRCIQCYRCVRYYRDYADGRDLNVFAAHDHVYFGRQEDGVLESEFSGNLVEVCPTGVFTDRTLKRHYTRKWDLQTAPSLCVLCGVGCNTIPGERYGTLRRIRNRYNDEVNGYFLCDRGRYGYEFVNSGFRIRQPMMGIGDRRPGVEEPLTPLVSEGVRVEGPADLAAMERPEDQGLRSKADPSQRWLAHEAPPSFATPLPGFQTVSQEAALQRVADILSNSAGVIGIGSPRASLESNFALRTLVRPDHFYAGMSGSDRRLVALALEALRAGVAPSPSLKEVRSADAVLVLGEDVTNVAPVLALALRQSARQQPMKKAAKLRIPLWNDAAVRQAIGEERGPLFIASVSATRLDDAATATYHGAPVDLARLGFAVARALDKESPRVPDLPEEARSLAHSIAKALSEAEKPLVVAGLSYGEDGIVHAAANVAAALRAAGKPALLRYAVPECNTLGLGLMEGGSLEDAFEAVHGGEADTVIILENDLYRRADAPAVDAFLKAARHVIVLDHLATETVRKAEVVLPAATFAESDGTLVNDEGRAQRFYQVFVPQGEILESWRWLREMMAAAGRVDVETWGTLDGVIAALASEAEVFAPVAEVAPSATFRLAGQKIPRQPQRYSGRTAMYAHIDVSEPKPPDDPDTPLAFSMEGYDLPPPPPLIPRFWAPGWNSNQSLNKFQSEVGGPLRGGSPGRRLIEPAMAESPPYHREVPEAFEPRPGEWLVVPLHHIFGSGELSILAPGVAELAPAPYLALNARELANRGLREGEGIEMLLGGRVRHLTIRLAPELPMGVAGLPAGLPRLEGIVLPVWVHYRTEPGVLVVGNGEDEA